MKRAPGVSVRLFGGIGNQIFQYMAGKSLAHERNVPLYIDNNWIIDGYSHAKSTITEFKFYKPDAEFGLGHRNKIHLYVDRISTVAARNSSLFANFSRINSPRNFGYVDLSKIDSKVQLRGYYQSPIYFQNLLKEGLITKDELDIIDPSLNFGKSVEGFSKEKFIAIHVRGGDYLKKNSPYVKLDVSYFRKAINFAIEELGNLQMWVFSDDIEYAQSIFSNFKNLNYFNVDGLSAAETLKIISKANAIVSANSTFSYWAGLMSEPQTIVFAPKIWLTSEIQSEEFFPKDWKLLNP